MLNKNKLVFILILLLAAFLRFYQLGQLPSSLNWDEVSHGYNAYSLLETGKDQWNQSWPIFNFRAYGDYPTAANLYLTIPFVKFLGLTAFSIRLPHAILSLLFVIFIFLFTRLLFKNQTLSYYAMFLAAISPWVFFPGRGVFQSNLSQLFLLIGLYLFYKQKPLFLLFFGISLYSYHNTRIIIPLLLPALLLLDNSKFIFKKTSIVYIVIFLFMAIPNLFNLFSPESTARNRWVGIINPNSINLINESRRLFTGPEFLNPIVNNKVVFFTKELTVNYLNLLNPFPLFFRGSENFQFNPPNTSLIFSVFLPFFYLGLLVVLKKHFRYFIYFLICLLPAALTIGDFPSIRATTALPFYLLFTALGLSLLKNKYFHYLIIIVSLIELFVYWQSYNSYNKNYSFTWQYGYEPMVAKLKSSYSDYDQIFITKKYGEPHEFILFYWPWIPSGYQTDLNLRTDFHADWYWVDAFDKFKFINDWEISTLALPQNSLLITSPDNMPPGVTLLDTINYPDGKPVFQFYSHEF